MDDLPERGRRWRQHWTLARDGQLEFRDALIRAYDGRCVISNCATSEALDAAHIEPYDGRRNSVVRNGLLLRADLHRLFDRGLLWVTAAHRVGIHVELRDGEYGTWHGRALRSPALAEHRPDPDLLAAHRERFGR